MSDVEDDHAVHSDHVEDLEGITDHRHDTNIRSAFNLSRAFGCAADSSNNFPDACFDRERNMGPCMT